MASSIDSPSLASYCSTLDSKLETDRYGDASLNGLQVASMETERPLKKIAFAVDAAKLSIEAAADFGAELLVVHHGLLWGQSERLVGLLGERVRGLTQSGISLYASHLPLDGNMELGNAVGVASKLGLTELSPFCEYNGTTIGARGRFAKPKSFQEVSELVRGLEHAANYPELAFGGNEISTVGIVTGSGSMAVEVCPNEGIDLLISGEPKHEVVQSARELGVNAIFAGHYATERFGVLSLQRLTQEMFPVETLFIETPSQL